MFWNNHGYLLSRIRLLEGRVEDLRARTDKIRDFGYVRERRQLEQQEIIDLILEYLELKVISVKAHKALEEIDGTDE